MIEAWELGPHRLGRGIVRIEAAFQPREVVTIDLPGLCCSADAAQKIAETLEGDVEVLLSRDVGLIHLFEMSINRQGFPAERLSI